MITDTIPIPVPKDLSSPETLKWAVRCKVGLRLFDKALAGVPVPGLKGAVASVASIIEMFEVCFNIFCRESTEEFHRYGVAMSKASRNFRVSSRV